MSADKWSKPERIEVEVVCRDFDAGPPFEYRCKCREDYCDACGSEREYHPYKYTAELASGDEVLRLLAAEASDRLGWVWEVENMGRSVGWVAQSVPADMPSVLKFRWLDNGSGPVSTKPQTFGHTPDELLAALHGKFLLEDAIREQA
jgi:hypothetical protein